MWEVLVKRSARNSTVACVATSDPIRVAQMKVYLATHGDYSQSEMYYFEPFHGLQQLQRSGNKHLYFEPVRVDGGEYARMAGVQNSMVDLNQALRHMDKILRARRSLLVLEHMDSTNCQDKKPQLLCALRSWAHDAEILHQGSLVVAVASNVAAVLDEPTKENAIVRDIPLAALGERLIIIDDLALELGIDISETRKRLAHATAGLNLHQLQCTLREAYLRHGGFALEFVRELKNEQIKKSGLLEVMEPTADGFASVGGYTPVKDFIKNKIIEVLQEPDRADRLVMALPRGFVFFGPPGTGKSILARALAAEINLPILNLRTEKLVSKWLGESGHNFDNAINLAEQMSPVILFMDEIDKLLRQRSGETSDGASGEMRNVLNQVLEWLGKKNRQSILVGATNRPQDLDVAAIRPGRIDYMIPMLYPDADARRQILMVHLGLRGGRPVPLNLNSREPGELLDSLVKKTEYFSGADLEKLVNKAKGLAFTARMDALTAEHFYEALETTHIDRDRRKRDVDHYLQLAREYSTDSDLLELD
jgi:ATP-dependent 26S proteasome regulatory subunit